MKNTLALCVTVLIVLGTTTGATTESLDTENSADLHLRVRRQESLVFAKRPSSISAELEDTVVFECSAESNGAQPTLTWHKDGQRVTSSQTGIFLLANKNLLVLVSRDNLGIYTCQLEVDGEVIRADASLTLKSDEDRIEFLDRPQNATVNFAERQVFRCDVAGDLQTTWLKDGSSMFLDGQRVFQHRGDLHITSATVADSGRYTCRVQNGEQTAEVHAWLSVKVDTELVCGRPVYKKGPDGFIVGGTEAEPGTIPWQAMLWDVRPQRNRHFCGGALVNTQWVLTAAHCIVEAEVTKDDFIVRLGKQVAKRGVFEENERSYTVQEVVVFTGFVHDTYDADVALIRLTERVLYTDYILPVCLPSVDRARRLIRPGSAGTVSGWGRVVEGGPYSNVLKKVLIPRVSQGRCRKAHPQYDVTRNMFCAGRPGGGEDACDGDSGGPFTVFDEDREYLLGVVSWGDGCALAGKFGVYTRLHKFFTWIQGTIQEDDDEEDAMCVNVASIPNGRVVIDNSATPARARYFCDPGHRLEGPAVRMCEPNGRWSGAPPRCTALQCPPIEAPRDGNVHVPRRQHGDIATYTCDPGFELKGPRSRLCQYGEWDGNEPRCEPAGCPIPRPPENGHVRFESRSHGSLATYTCTAGYDLTGPHRQECVYGHWADREPACEKRVVLCPPIEAPANGAVQVSGRESGDSVTFSCDPGYEMEGLRRIQCVDGVWDGDEPTCEAAAPRCPPIEAPRDGNVHVPRRQHGDMASYTCDPGFELKGPRSRLCQYGEWDGNEPRCEPAGCPIPRPPENGHVRFETRSHGSLATYTCTSGYDLTGPHRRECVYGHWADREPACEKREVQVDFPRDCDDWYDQGERISGVYSVQPRDSDEIVSVWCEFGEGGAWTVIQRRQDGSVDFFRNWQEYKDGFGDSAGEYWLGNRNIFYLSDQARYKLRINLKDFNGRTFFAEYSHFRVENEANDYTLRLGNHSGNIGDSMKLDRDQPFTTKDHGAQQGSHCARVQKTGWWFGDVCLNWANLNGIYKDSGEYTGEQNGIFWFHLRTIGYPELHSLKEVTMKLQRTGEPSEGEVTPSTTPTTDECQGQCSGTSCELKGVENPVDHKTSGFIQGAWMKDPTGDPDVIYYMNNYYVGSIQVYRNLNDFKNDHLQKTIKVSACGTGHVIYNGNFYSTRHHSNKMFKMNLKTRATVEKVLLNAGHTNTYHYRGKSLTDIDFAIDEKGLWVIYATPQNGGRIVVSRLNPDDLSIIQTWNTTYTKGNAANAFMICGVLYTVVGQRKVDYAFDTVTGQERSPDLPFPTITSDIRHLSYNHRERRLYAWRAGHQVTYDLELTGVPEKGTESYADCDDVKRAGKQGTGVFWIKPRGTTEPFPVSCDLQDGEGAWTVIQRRRHTETENFTRGWEDYKNGFGVISRDYWLGNEKVHQLTKDGNFRVKIQVRSFGGLQGSYEFDNFKVAGEDDNYRLTLSGFTGRVNSCMDRAAKELNGMSFSTIDRDNDRAGYSCAERWKGGWWYRSCSLLILNGVIKEYNGHDEYREVTGRGEGLFNVCLQQGPPVSLSEVTIKIQAREQPDVYRDCDHARSEGKTTSGVYQIQPQGAPAPFPAFCEMESSGGGWTVIQRRTRYGTVNFTRGWEDYKNGFGDIEGELWLGLEHIHALTNQGRYALQIDFKGYTGSSSYTLYSSFKVASESDVYRLDLGNRVSGRSDCLNTRSTGKNVSGMAFSTFDRDHDLASYNCAEKYRGGWWYNRCSSVIINGVKKYWKTHEQYYKEVLQGLGLYNVCMQAGPPVSLADVTMKISTYPNSA